MEDTDEAVVAIEDPDCVAASVYSESVPPEVCALLLEFGTKVRGCQYEQASTILMRAADSGKNTPVEGARSYESASAFREQAVTAIWKDVLLALSQLATAEQCYTQLPFLHSSRALPQKREIELMKLLSLANESFTRISRLPGVGNVPRHVAEQCIAFMSAKEKLIQCHRNIVTANETGSESLEEIEENLDRILELPTGFHHPLLAELAHNFVTEAEILRSCIGIQSLLRKMQIMDTIVRLKELRERLQFWVKTVEWGEKHRPGALKGLFSHAPRPFDRWFACRTVAYLCSYHAWLVLRFTIVFHETLQPYTNPIDDKLHLTDGNGSADGLSVGELIAPLRRIDKDAVLAVLMDRSNEKTPFYGLNYRLPGSSERSEGKEVVTGIMNTFPALFVSAVDRSTFTRHYPKMVDVLVGGRSSLNEGRTAYSLRKDAETARYVCIFADRVSPSLLVVVMLPCKKTEKDPGVAKYMTNLVATLKGATLAPLWRTS